MLKTTLIAGLGLTILAAVVLPGDEKCQLKGKLTDKNTGESLPFTSIQLLTRDSIPFSSSTTDVNGDFCFTDLDTGAFMVVVSHIGHAKYVRRDVRPGNQDLNIALATETPKLQEVVVTENKLNVRGARGNSTKDNISMPSSGLYYNITAVGSTVSYAWTAESDSYNTEEYSSIKDNEFRLASKDPLSTFSIDVDRASYSNVRRYINDGSLPPADAVRIEELINYFSYKYPAPTGSDPFSITTEYTECPWNKDHKLVHVGIQGKAVELTNMPANNLVFLIDVSGSMESPDKLPLLVSGLRMLTNEMRPQDKISVVVYAGAAGVVLEPTSGNKKADIIEALEKLTAGGSTAGGAGIELAYKIARENYIEKGNNRVILATDGDFNVGVSSEGELTRLIEKKRQQGIFLTALGFGTGNLKDSRMEQLADKGNGNYSYIDNLLEAKKTLVKEMGGTLLTIAKDVKIQVEFNPAHVKAYRLVGYENRVLANEDFNDDKKDAGELGAGHTVTAMYEIIPAGSGEEVASVDDLKYQQTSTEKVHAYGNEVMTVKFRYKDPNANTSKLMIAVVMDRNIRFDAASENLRFAASVAEFGMLLRDSKYKKDSSWDHLLITAKAAKGKDDEGYRAEFIRLAETASLMKKE